MDARNERVKPAPKARTKKNALLSVINASSRSNLVDIHKHLDEYVKAPRAGLDLKLFTRYHHLYTSPTAYMEKLAAEGYPQLQRWFHRVPKKRNLVRNTLGEWTTPAYKFIQTARRGPFREFDNTIKINLEKKLAKGRRDAAWLARYMTHHALRAPALPRDAPRGPLYRGMRMTEAELLGMLNSGKWSDRGFMSFTRQSSYADAFGQRRTRNTAKYVVLFRLRLGDVQRGTPWIWYAGWDIPNALKTIDHLEGWVIPEELEEQEVTFPPGTLRVLSVASRLGMETALREWRNTGDLRTRVKPVTFVGMRADLVVDVAFEPAPEFKWKPRRKGTRESDENILWNIFANKPVVTRKRARSPSPNQPSRKPRTCTIM